MGTGRHTLRSLNTGSFCRMQIHVEVRSEDDVRLTIFSKSKRNATVDRLNTHA